MTVLNPIWLWALSGVAIPVAIHLLSRKEGKTIRIGSIRFLTETTTSKFSSIRLNEVVLLALRCLLIALLVLFFARLLFFSSDNKNALKWIVIEKGLENNGAIRKHLDSLAKDAYEIRSLSSAFPLLHEDTVTDTPDYYQLVEELSQKNNLHAIVIASNTLSGFRGKRIALPANIKWLSYPASKQESSHDADLSTDSLHITLVNDRAYLYDKKIMRAALQVLPIKIILHEMESSRLEKTDSDWLIWLSDKEPAHTGRLLRLKEDVTSDFILQETKNTWILTKRLTEEHALEQHLAVKLMRMLLHERIEAEIRKQDFRTLPDELAWSESHTFQSRETIQAGQPADKILIVWIALLFISERIFAFYRKQ